MNEVKSECLTLHPCVISEMVGRYNSLPVSSGPERIPYMYT